jgi:hypothetical protein
MIKSLTDTQERMLTGNGEFTDPDPGAQNPDPDPQQEIVTKNKNAK